MERAVKEGDAKKLAELIRQDPGFDVNMDRNRFGVTLLHVACYRDSRSAVIPLLPAHPDIDVSEERIWTGSLSLCLRWIPLLRS